MLEKFKVLRMLLASWKPPSGVLTKVTRKPLAEPGLEASWGTSIILWEASHTLGC